MSKKLIAILLSVLVLLSFAAIPAAAASDAELENAQFKSAVEQAVGGIIGAEEGDKVVADDAFVQELAEYSKAGAVTKFFVKNIAKYVFINADYIEDSDEVAKRIADNASYKVRKITGNKETVYIVVNLQENPEICNLAVFQKVVKELYANQEIAMSEFEAEKESSVNWKIMSYEHIAGELALHALVYNLTDSQGASNKYHIFHPIWKSAKDAELNVDEMRIPSSLIRSIGKIIMQLKSIAEILSK